MRTALLGLQVFHVLFLALHDWVPLGRLNDVRRVRAENSLGKLLAATLVSTAPFAFVLGASLVYMGRTYPGWLWAWLWWSYLILFVGELQAWWVPYVFGAGAERVARYEAMFGGTAAFVPARNGIRPNTLHVVLHVLTAVTVGLVGVLRWGR